LAPFAAVTRQFAIGSTALDSALANCTKPVQQHLIHFQQLHKAIGSTALDSAPATAQSRRFNST
jgi:hypothetical protein